MYSFIAGEGGIWILLLGIIILKLIHAVACNNSFFLYTVEQYSFVWIGHNLVINSPADGHLGCFCFG